MPGLKLPGGRILSYAEYGSSGGEPIIIMHGLPGSRLQRHPDESLASDLNVRLIHVDRPGFGDSSPKRGRRLLDMAEDIAHLADALRLERFRVAGISGGGPFAAACAYALPDRVKSLGLISSVAPPEWMDHSAEPAVLLRLVYRLAARGAWTLLPFLGPAGFVGRHRPDWYLRVIIRYQAGVDRPLLLVPATRAMFHQDFRAAFRQGAGAMAWDLHLIAGDWGFDPAGIKVPCRLWHGLADPVVPPSHGRWLADRIPGCHADYLADAGHFFVFEHWPAILSQLLRD
jgi:pimeloyl-ACP methyl ester carboxylesterase